MTAILPTTFSNAFCWMKMFQIANKISLTYAPGLIGNRSARVRSLFGAASNQANTWPNVDQDPWCHMALQGHDELKEIFMKYVNH